MAYNLPNTTCWEVPVFKRRFVFPLFSLALLVALILPACAPKIETATPAVLESPTPTATALPPTTELTICLGQEPASLYPVDNPSSAARAVLAAIYDGPVDTVSYEYQPVILARLPSLENGDAQLFQTPVYVGDEVVDAAGNPVTLQAGDRIRPAGCRSDSCAIAYDGKSEVQMDQMNVTFDLLPGLLWSDGDPLTAADSVYSYEIATASGNSYLAARTKSYEAADDTTVQWWGKPGFVDPTYVTNFFMPLPSHLWSNISADQLPDSDAASLRPVGWGPYVISEWEKGDYMTLTKNPYYFRAGEGLPKIDVLTFRFTPDPDTAVSELLAGRCDVLDPSISLDGQVALLQSLQKQGQIEAFFSVTPVMEQLAFGILPAEYDNGNNPDFDRPDFFGDVRVRQAVAMCIDRQKIVDSVLYGLSSVPDSYVPSGHPLYDSSLPVYSFDVNAANALLEKAGWRDVDGNPSTPRQAWGIAKIANGTPFSVTYITTGAAQRVQVSSLVAESLAQCGIQVNVKYLDQADLYAPGPAGPLFGRAFTLAEFAMGSTGIEPPCEWYTSSEIPDSANRWVGTNLSGYSNVAFDSACSTARQSLPDEAAYLEAYQQAQSLFAQDLPVLPLYWRIRTAAARPQVCGFSLDPTTSSSLWNIESMDIGDNCAP
jgi:peptide/nickel transport system substrate-binding protein